MDESLIYLVLSIVDEIPYGKVCTYGDLARLSGYPKHARLMGRILSQAASYGTYPCHRVVNAQGRLVPGWDEQKGLLADEGVTFMNSGCVNLKKHRYIISGS